MIHNAEDQCEQGYISIGEYHRIIALLRDVEPVVRCNECKHCYVDFGNVRFNVCELDHNKVQADDWFCADGERKEG